MRSITGVCGAIVTALLIAGAFALQASALTISTVAISLPGFTLDGAEHIANTSNGTWRADGEGVPAPWHVNVSSTDFGIDEVQQVFNNATAGTFTLTFSGQTTAAIAYDAAAGTVETDLQDLSNVTDVTVSGSGTSGDPWVVTFVDPGKQNVAEMTADDSNLTGGTSTISTTVTGSNIDVSFFEIRLLDASISPVSGPPNPRPSSTQTTYAALSATDLKIVSAVGVATERAWDLIPDFRLTVAPEAYAGTYTATVTITIANGP